MLFPLHCNNSNTEHRIGMNSLCVPIVGGIVVLSDKICGYVLSYLTVMEIVDTLFVVNQGIWVSPVPKVAENVRHSPYQSCADEDITRPSAKEASDLRLPPG